MMAVSEILVCCIILIIIVCIVTHAKEGRKKSLNQKRKIDVTKDQFKELENRIIQEILKKQSTKIKEQEKNLKMRIDSFNRQLLILRKREKDFDDKCILEKAILKNKEKGLYDRYSSKIVELEQKERELDDRYNSKAKDLEERENLINTKSAKFPQIAKALAELEEAKLLQVADILKTKQRHAYVAAEEVRLAAKKVKRYAMLFHAAKNLLNNYETWFPWITEYKEFDINEIIAEQTEDSTDINEDENDPVKHYMTSSEYQKLSPVERNQKALDNYLGSRKKSNWQIGRQYERYIGFLYEQKGYKVSYFGAKNGLEDLGRDIIAVKENQHLVIQCKYWKKGKLIRENTICQLFGTTVRYRINYSEEDLFGKKYDVHAVLITSSECSDMAKDFAKYLNVEIEEHKDYRGDYPMIKCNISSNGERIYHLPFDQQYDNIVIEPLKGEKYVKTCAEAEEDGFSRAYRWKGTV